MTVDQSFADDLERLINHYRIDYAITYAQLVGVLQIQSFMLCREAEQIAEDDNTPEELEGLQA